MELNAVFSGVIRLQPLAEAEEPSVHGVCLKRAVVVKRKFFNVVAEDTHVFYISVFIENSKIITIKFQISEVFPFFFFSFF